MNRILTSAILSVILLTARAFAEEPITVERFREIAATPGDSVPLNDKLRITPVWTNSVISLSLKYNDGKAFQEKLTATTKTVAGKYIISSVQSKFLPKPIDSILSYDENARRYKVWGLAEGKIVEGTMIFDLDKKTFATQAAYGDGLTELGLGSFSDTETSSRTFVYKNGTLLNTREMKTSPTSEGK